MGWFDNFFNISSSPEINNIRKELSPLKSKVGELGAEIAIGTEKGHAPSELQKMEFKRTAELLILKLQELKELIKFKIDASGDPKLISNLTSEIAQVDKQILNLNSQIKNF